MIIETIVSYHRQQRYAVKMQSRADRAMEAFIARFVFGFSPMLEDESERKEIFKKTAALMKQCRNGDAPAEYLDIIEMVLSSDKSRATWDDLRNSRENAMKKFLKQLPVYEWVKTVPGVAKGIAVAQIIGEAGDLSNYSTFAKLWKRLGLAPYKGFAMSTWMRESWRPHKISNEEWNDESLNLFWKPERYAIMAQIAQWLWVKQWIGKEKAPPNGEPDGRYGEVYARRRARTRETHPDWSPMHAHKDALRIMMKVFVRDLWRAWRRTNLEMSTGPEKLCPPPTISDASGEGLSPSARNGQPFVALPARTEAAS